MAVTMESATFMGKNFMDNQNSIVNTTDLTLKQMFGISSKLVGEQDEISNLETIGWEKHSWNFLSLIGDERVINLQRAKVHVFSNSVLCLGKIHQHPNAHESWKKEVWYRTMVIHWSRFRKEVVFYGRGQCTRNLGPYRGKDVVGICRRHMSNFPCCDSLSRGKLRSKGHGKLSIHYCADQATIETIVRIIVSANELSLYGAVANMCEEYESLHDRSGRPVVMGQSIVLSEMKTEVPLDCDDPANQNFVLQQYGERIGRLSQQDKVSKFCMDAGFLSIVEIGQYFMTKDTGEQFHAVACREYTLPREEAA